MRSVLISWTVDGKHCTITDPVCPERDDTIVHTPIAPDGCSPLNRIMRQPYQWELVSADFAENTGAMICVYERTTRGQHEIVTIMREHPHGRRHIGWKWFDGKRTVHEREILTRA